ncbi:hypothetical protein QWM81_26805, partial [Streptomyces ficellus]|nr:hypothetical protein [Streptomyces ficellus]
HDHREDAEDQPLDVPDAAQHRLAGLAHRLEREAGQERDQQRLSPDRVASARTTVVLSRTTSRSWRTRSTGPAAGPGADGTREAGSSGSGGTVRSASTRSNGPGSRGRTRARPPAPPAAEAAEDAEDPEAAAAGEHRVSSRSK